MHFANVIEEEAIGIQIGIVPETLPHTGFQIYRQPTRQLLTMGPFRLGEHPNVRVGVAMITSAPEALALHRKTFNEMWKRVDEGQRGAEMPTRPCWIRRIPRQRRRVRAGRAAHG